MREPSIETVMNRARVSRFLADPRPTHRCSSCKTTTSCKVTYPSRYDDYCSRCGGSFIFERIPR
jgi:hypothetical protein